MSKDTITRLEEIPPPPPVAADPLPVALLISPFTTPFAAELGANEIGTARGSVGGGSGLGVECHNPSLSLRRTR